MNCDRCGIEYKEDVPHPPVACATYASDELKKAKAALDGALAKISELAKERDQIFNSREINMAIDSVSRNYGRLRDFLSGPGARYSAAEISQIQKEMEELREFHLRLVKWYRNTPKKSP